MNDRVKQNGCTSDMIFKIPALIEHVSSIMTLEVRLFFSASVLPSENLHLDLGATHPLYSPTVTNLFFQVGDLILTGTPSGVGQVKPGDKVHCKLEDNATGAELAKFEFEAIERGGRYEFKM